MVSWHPFGAFPGWSRIVRVEHRIFLCAELHSASSGYGGSRNLVSAFAGGGGAARKKRTMSWPGQSRTTTGILCTSSCIASRAQPGRPEIPERQRRPWNCSTSRPVRRCRPEIGVRLCGFACAYRNLVYAWRHQSEDSIRESAGDRNLPCASYGDPECRPEFRVHAPSFVINGWPLR